MSKLDDLIKGFDTDWYHDGQIMGAQPARDEAKQQIKGLFLELIGEDNEHHKDIPVPDPDPFALPSDYQNQLRRYLRNKVEEL